MIRAAIYARFSSDKQNDKSVDDQIAFCREICARNSFAVAMTFSDHEIAGFSTVNRPGFQSLMRTADARLFDVVVCEDLDRMFRDQADYHAARKRLEFIGIGFHDASGKVGRLDGSLRALIGEYQLENMAVHVRRGLEAVIRDGRHAGGRAYGYAIVPGRKGELVIDEAEAGTVRRIFKEFIAGRTPRAIAAGLNDDLKPPPRGVRWNASTINGNATRGHGMLLNELYAGRIVWNKVRMVKDPATGKRVSRPNKAAEYRSADVPHLRIVDDETWQDAQKIKAKRSHIGAARSRAPKRPLSGLLRCGSCGSGMASVGVTKGTTRLQCSAHRENGSCGNGRKVNRDAIEAEVFAGLRDELRHPEAIAEYVKVYNAERRRLGRSSSDEISKLKRREAAVGRELARAIDAVTQGAPLKALVPKIDELQAEQDKIAAELAQLASAKEVVTLHPASIERYARDVSKLAELAATNSDFSESADLVAAMRPLVAEVIIYAQPGGRGFEIEVKGRLAELAGDKAMFPARSAGGVIDGSERGTHAFTPPRELLFSFRRTAMAA